MPRAAATARRAALRTRLLPCSSITCEDVIATEKTGMFVPLSSRIRPSSNALRKWDVFDVRWPSLHAPRPPEKSDLKKRDICIANWVKSALHPPANAKAFPSKKNKGRVYRHLVKSVPIFITSLPLQVHVYRHLVKSEPIFVTSSLFPSVSWAATLLTVLAASAPA